MITGMVFGSAGIAFAFNSGGNPGTTGPNTISWTGQGANKGTLGSTQCNGQDGVPAGTPYLLWILTVDGGSIQHDATTPTLTLGGSGSGSFQTTDPSPNAAIHFITPYFTPDSNLIATAAINVLTTGNGAWNLVISHGCPGGTTPPASDLTATKEGSGSYDNTYVWTIDKNVDQTKFNIGEGEKATANYTIDVSHDGGTISNVAASGTVTVINSNDADVTIDSVVDDVAGCTITDSTQGAVIPANGSSPFAFSCDFGDTVPSNFVNTATVSWSEQDLSDGSHLDANTAIATSDPIAFTENAIDECNTVSDPMDPNSPHTFCVGDPGDPNFSFQYSKDFEGEAGTCTKYDNTASFETNDTKSTGSDSETVTVCVVVNPTATKAGSGSYDNTIGWTIDKNVDETQFNIPEGGKATANYTVDVSHDSGTVSNVAASGTVTVVNSNDSAVTIDSVVDDVAGCTVTGGVDVVVQANDQAELPFSCDFGSTIPAAPFVNTATVSWSAQDLSSGAHLDASTAVATSDTIAFTENTIDECNTVSDPMDPNSPHTFCVGDPGDPNFSFQYSKDFEGEAGTCTKYDNTASFETNDTKSTGSDSETVTVCVGSDLTVSKTANPTFKRTYTWDINKDVDKTEVKQVGGTATFNYTVQVNQTGVSDSDWAATGTITITNPNDWEDITVDVSDAVDNGGDCTIDGGGTGVVVPAGSDKTVDYTCTWSSAPSASSGTNTATVTWDKDAAHTPGESAKGTKDFAFTTPTSTSNKTITVVDTYKGTLGTVTATDTPPYASKTFQYSRTINVTPGCHDYPNTATITETGQSDSQSVKVCGPTATGALTIGFWKNTNGQNLIKTYCQGTTLANYLKGLGGGSGPFADAPTSSCSALATYVANILGAASGSDMNKMLKAQMLGTALDVWFSGPGWTSTKSGSIKPPSNFLSHNSLGGFKMDTTAVCPMVDNSSSGSATCTGNKPSTDAVASGVVPTSPMTMQAILDYAATSPSPFNNGVWFANNKTKQEILKNIFDQFNNDLAFGSF